MEENKKDVLPLEGEPLTTPQISEPVVNALAAALSKIETYVPTQYIDDGPPDIDADHLNHAEQAIMRVTNLANGAADAIAALQSQVTQLNNNFQLVDNATRFVVGSSEKSKSYMRTNNSNGEMFQFVLSESGIHFSGYYGKYGDSGKTLWTGVTKSDLKTLKKADVQFSNGFTEISFPGITYNSNVCITQEYRSSDGVQNLVFTAQVRPNELIIYARNADDGSSYNGILNIMVIAIG